MDKPQIYFAASIRGGRHQASRYDEIIRFLQRHGNVFTEHIGDDETISLEEKEFSEKEIHDRDMKWLEQADMIIAEVTVPSLGVGYEIANAIQMGKPILALFDESSGNMLSAMIAGSDSLTLMRYDNMQDLYRGVSDFLDQFCRSAS